MTEENTKLKITNEIDISDLLCHVVPLELRARIADIPVGTVMKVTSSNKTALNVIPKWCKASGQELFFSIREGTFFAFYIRRKL